MAKEKIDMVQTAFRFPIDFLKEIKVRAMNLNISLQKWVMQAIVEKMAREDKAK